MTLVLLRHAAEGAGLDAVAILGEAALLASAEVRPAFENARDHAPADVEYTARAFGEAGTRSRLTGGSGTGNAVPGEPVPPKSPRRGG